MKNNLLACYFVPHPPLIVPDIGKGEEQKIIKTIEAYQEVAKEIAVLKPDTILFVSPHALTYADYFHIEKNQSSDGSFADFGAPNLTFEVHNDKGLVTQIETLAKRMNIMAGTAGRQNNRLDHGIMVPLYFINQHYQNFRSVRLSFSGLSNLEHYNYGKVIQEVIFNNPDKKYVLIASGDLSHMLKDEGPYGFAEEGPLFDQKICTTLASGSFLDLFTMDPSIIEGAGECGFRSLLILAGLLDRLAIIPKLLSYEGPFGVGYAVASYKIKEEDMLRDFGEQGAKKETEHLQKTKLHEDAYTSLARKALETYVLTGKTISDEEANGELKGVRAGVFVSLKKNGSLRGCIGTTGPTTDCVAQEIIQNAISSGTGDPRFDPVQKEELPYLVYSVDVLNKAERISSPAELDVKKYGVIVRYRGRSGLLLPNLEGVNTVNEQLKIVLHKAGIDSDEPYSLERFEVVRHK
ncbi:MAG: AmmeMemoRadiSam system protein A [Bacilli bacterium]